MRRLRSILARIATFPGGRDDDPTDGPVYECTYCRCTAAVRADRCRECRRGRLVPVGVGSSEGVTCRSCRSAIDPRYERCPECQRPRGNSAG